MLTFTAMNNISSSIVYCFARDFYLQTSKFSSFAQFPHIKKAIELSSTDILFFGSPWAPPAWMKTNGKFNGSGELLPEYWQPYSEYIVKFVEAYEAEGIPMWGLTPANEPMSGLEVRKLTFKTIATVNWLDRILPHIEC